MNWITLLRLSRCCRGRSPRLVPTLVFKAGFRESGKIIALVWCILLSCSSVRRLQGGVVSCTWGSIAPSQGLSLPPCFLCPLAQLYRAVGETPCHLVSSLDELVELNEKLLGCQEFAVDLEVPSSHLC